MRRLIAGMMAGCLMLGMAPGSPAADGRKARLSRADAGTQVRLGGKGPWAPATAGMVLGSGDDVRTPRGAVAELTYGDGTVSRLGPGSTLSLRDAQTRGVRLWLGRLWLKVAKGSGGMRIQTPAAVAAVTGTELFVFHEGRDQQGALPRRVAGLPGIPLAATANVSTIGLLEGAVNVQRQVTDFDTGLIPGARGLWLAATGLGGLPLAQLSGMDLTPGNKAIADPQLPNLRILPMTPDEITNNRSVLSTFGPNGDTKPTESRRGEDKKPEERKPADSQPANTPPPPVTTPPGQPTPAPVATPPVPPTAPPAVPPPAPVPPPDVTRNTMEQLIRPVDRSPNSGELEIIIK